MQPQKQVLFTANFQLPPPVKKGIAFLFPISETADFSGIWTTEIKKWALIASQITYQF